MTSYTFVAEGKPRAKERPRLGRRGRVFTPERTLEAERAIAAQYTGPYFDCPVLIQIGYGLDHQVITITERSDWANESKSRADLDNLVKLTLDGLNGVAFKDDKAVVEIHGWKE